MSIESTFDVAPKPQTMGTTTGRVLGELAGDLSAKAVDDVETWQGKAIKGAPRQE